MAKSKKPALVTQYLENISSEAFDTHADIIRRFVRGRIGIYALYRRGKLYYAGLASDLRGRLRTHSHDRHKGGWDTFSVYLTIGDKHLRELESLILRVVQPPGNRQLGKFSGAQNLNRHFGQAIAKKQRAERNRILGRESAEEESTQGVTGVAGFEQDTKKSLYTRCCAPTSGSGSNASYMARHPPQPQRFVNTLRMVGHFGIMNAALTIGCLSMNFGSKQKRSA